MLAAGLLVAVLASPKDAPAKTPGPNILLITVDTLRPDALGWVAGRNATPNIDSLALGGFRFPKAVAPAPLTLPSHATLLTGLLPVRHGVHDNGRVLAGTVPTLAEILRRAGYATGAVVSGYPLRAMFGLDRGFDDYDELLVANGRATTERPANEASRVALAWLTSPRIAGRPWFLWVHYFDAHDPYTPPPAFLRPGPRGAYDGEVAFVDDAVGVLRKGVAALGAGPTLTVLAGDHGESLGEHGEETHGYFVYDSTVLVPLVFEMPGGVRKGEDKGPARLVDVMPTLLDLAGVPQPAGLDGVSLRPTLEGRRQQIPPAMVESQYAWLAYGWAPLVALRTREWTLVKAPRPELYDLLRDPGERANVAEKNGDVVRRLAAELRTLEAGRGTEAAAVNDPEAAARLRSLGYASGGSTAASPPSSGLPDPKDRLEEKKILEDAERLFLANELPAAYAGFRTILEVEPSNRLALLRAGAILVKTGKPEEGIRLLRRAVASEPTNGEAQFALADALTGAGRYQEALREWERMTTLQPKRSAAWSNLGAVLAQERREEEGEQALVRALELDPASPTYRLNLAELRYRMALAAAVAGDAAAVQRLLPAAIQVAPGLEKRARADKRLAPYLPGGRRPQAGE